jgi:hypothetical protein
LFNALRLLLQFPPPLQNCFLSQKKDLLVKMCCTSISN